MSANIHSFTPEQYSAWAASASETVLDIGGTQLTALEYAAKDWSFTSRPGQRFVPGDEMLTIYSAGRGFGKTRIGSEAIHEAAMDPEAYGGHALIIAPEPGHIRDYCIEGPSGIIATAKPWLPLKHKPSQRCIEFRDPRGGGVGLTVRYASSFVPKQMRGPNVGLIWCDEFAFCQFPRDKARDNFFETARDASRAGECRAFITTTPLPIPELVGYAIEAVNPECPSCGKTPHPKQDVKFDVRPYLARAYTKVDPRFSVRTTCPRFTCECGQTYLSDVRWVQGSTFDNTAHLAKDYIERRVKKRAGTRIGHQEVGGGLLLDQPGTTIKSGWLRTERSSVSTAKPGWEIRVRETMGLSRVVIWVDPAKTSGEKSDESGVVVGGMQEGTDFLVMLEDLSVTAEDAAADGAPSNTWAPVAWKAARRWMADISCEDNVIGQLVGEQVLKAGRVVEGQRLAEAEGLEWEALGPRTKADLVDRAWRSLDWKPSVGNVSQYKSKPLRWDWGAPFIKDGQIVFLLPAGRDYSYWADMFGSLSGFSPLQKGPHKRDRGDACLGVARTLRGVDEGSADKRKEVTVPDVDFSGFGRM